MDWSTLRYRLLAHLEAGVGGKRLVSEACANQWPRRGVYLFFENGEARRASSAPRVVRVGTHAISQGSRATLWNRLSTHRGTSAGSGQSASSDIRRAEEELERRVSNEIAAMQLLWLTIDDEPSRGSDRADIERNLIGLFSSLTGPTDAPSLGWLGHHSRHDFVRRSGLWNVNHTEYQPDSGFLNVLEEDVRATIGSGPAPTSSIAPVGWLDRA